jgi:hypothetical protein
MSEGIDTHKYECSSCIMQGKVIPEFKEVGELCKDCHIDNLEAKLKESEDKNNKTYNQAINDALEIIADSSESGCYDVVDRLLKESENE